MARTETKKTTTRALIERTSYTGGETMIAFAAELYGTQTPHVVRSPTGTRIVLPSFTALLHWLNVTESDIAGHIESLISDETRP